MNEKNRITNKSGRVANFGKIVWVEIILITQPYNITVNAQPSTGSAEPSPYSYSWKFDPALAMMVIAFIVMFLIIGALSFLLRYYSEEYPSPASAAPASVYRQRRVIGLEPCVIEALPVLIYSSAGKEPLECAVCLSEFKDEDKLRLLPQCSHVFHTDCIDAWLSRHVTCPVCRSDLSKTNSLALPQQPLAMEPEPQPEEVVINVNGTQSGQDVVVVNNVRGANNGTLQMQGKLRRSHSTGHSLVEQGESFDKYTWRLPREATAPAPHRVRSFKGENDDGGSCGGPRRWVLLRTPPFGFRTGSVHSWKGEFSGCGGDYDGSVTRMISSLMVPFNYLSGQVGDSGCVEALHDRVRSMV